MLDSYTHIKLIKPITTQINSKGFCSFKNSSLGMIGIAHGVRNHILTVRQACHIANVAEGMTQSMAAVFQVAVGHGQLFSRRVVFHAHPNFSNRAVKVPSILNPLKNSRCSAAFSSSGARGSPLVWLHSSAKK